MADFRLDIRHGVRVLRMNHVFTAVAVLTLALGIGANAAIFSIVNAVLLRALPFAEPERLVAVSSRRADANRNPFTLPDFLDFRDRNRTLSGIAAYGSWNPNLTGTGDPERLSGVRASAGLFDILGVQAVAGRTLRAADDVPGNERVVVLGHALWQRRFGADPAVVGRQVILNGAGYEVVGVLPPEFIFPVREAEVAVPLAPDADPLRGVRTSVNFLRAVARLKPGVTREQAEGDLTAVAQRLRQEYPVANAHKVGVIVGPLHEELVGHFRIALLVLFGAVGLVLLIASVNLANLTLARASARRREMAVRAAVGATPWRLVRQLATESLLLALLGGSLGLLLAWYGTDLLLAISPAGLPRMAEVGLDLRVVWFALGVSLLAGTIFGTGPAFQAARVNLEEELKGSRRGSSPGARQRRARGLLVVSEVGLSLVLLVGAGLLVRSFFRLQAVDPGFRTENVLAVRLSLPKARYASSAAAAAFFDTLRQRLEALPGVASVGAVSSLPLSGVLANVPFTIEGRAAAPDADLRTHYRLAGDGYFRTLGIPLVAGRDFDERDTAEAPPVVLISQGFARRFWPDGDPVGAHLRIDDNDTGPRQVTILGVVGDVRHLGLDSGPEPHLYVPIRQTNEDAVGILTNNQYWLVRTTVEPLTISRAVRSAIQEVDPDVPASDIRTMDQYLAASVAPRRFNLRLLAVFAAAALLLAVTGLYGVISYGVAQRTHEIGIRMALGARRRDVLRLVMRQGMALALGGVAIGLVAAVALTRSMRSLLFDVGATDPATFGLVALLLLGVASLACYVPARRATRVAPVTALRCD
jgi:putative ABC transport system permease protein